MTDSERRKQTLARSNLPVPDTEVLDLNYSASNGDWYIKTADGWFWIRGDAGPKGKVWKHVPHYGLREIAEHFKRYIR